MEKPDIEHVSVVTYDSVEHEKSISTTYIGDHATTRAPASQAERSLFWKSRILIVPLAALIYFSAYLDRNSIGNARVLGLQKDLKLTSNQYYNCLTMFFVGYCIFMLPGNIVLRYLSPHMVIGGAVLIFGSLLCGMSVARNYQTVLALRILIGASQAFIQGLGLYTSLWFKRDEIATIGASYYSAATISGAFSGLIAYGCLKDLTEASTGRSPWRWLFIIEGAVAMGVGLLVIILMPRFPDKMEKGKHWLFTAEEIKIACERASSFNTIGAKIAPIQIWEAIKDPKSWAFVWMQAGVATGIGTVGVFLPTFIEEFGYSPLRTQLFSVIPYACAFVTLIAVAYTSDRVNKKGVFLIGSMSFACIGYIILLTNASARVKVFATCLVTSGLYPSVVLIVAWLASNTAGFTKRGTTWAMAEISGQCFSIMGTHVYTDPPRFIQGHSVILAFMIFAVLNATALLFWMKHLNQKKERVDADYRERNEVHPHTSRSLEEEYDYHHSFRYIL